jgi:hypothetical protein
MNRLATLRDDLWTRWRQQGERLRSVLEEPTHGDAILYSRGKAFDLKKYTPGKLAAGARTSVQPYPGLDNHVYHVDHLGRPIRSDFRHSYNKVDWRGVYTYSPDSIEYSEWCLQTGVCSQYDRVGLDGGQLSTFQRLTINAAGSVPAWRGLFSKVMDLIASETTNYSIWIEAYDHSDGRIVSGVKYTEGLGSPPLRASLTYMYAGDKLERILHRWESGEEETIYVARRTASFKQLSADLSRRIADSVIEVVRDARLSAPVQLLELSYLSLESLAPTIVPSVEGDHLASLALVSELDSSRWIQMREEEFAPDITDFRQRVQSTGAYGAAGRMLRNAARQVTERGPAHFPTAEHFVAYAIDWEAEGDELERILLECGASAEAVTSFHARGWL